MLAGGRLNARGWIPEPFALAFPLSAKERLVLMLYLYLDETGTHAEAGNIGVAGYLAREEQWSAFQAAWQEELTAYSIPFFHMTDFLARRGHFQDWPEQKRMPRLRKLIRIINRHAAASIGQVIPVKLFAEVRTRYPLARGSAYHYCAVATFAWAAQIADSWDLPPSEPINYVMAAGAPGRTEVESAFNQIFENTTIRRNYRMIGMDFYEAQRILPLQAADILANTLYRQLPRFLSNRASATDEISDLARIKERRWERFTEANIEYLLGEAHRREEARRSRKGHRA